MTVRIVRVNAAARKASAASFLASDSPPVASRGAHASNVRAASGNAPSFMRHVPARRRARSNDGSAESALRQSSSASLTSFAARIADAADADAAPTTHDARINRAAARFA